MEHFIKYSVAWSNARTKHHKTACGKKKYETALPVDVKQIIVLQITQRWAQNVIV